MENASDRLYSNSYDLGIYMGFMRGLYFSGKITKADIDRLNEMVKNESNKIQVK